MIEDLSVEKSSRRAADPHKGSREFEVDNVPVESTVLEKKYGYGGRVFVVVVRCVESIDGER